MKLQIQSVIGLPRLKPRVDGSNREYRSDEDNSTSPAMISQRPTRQRGPPSRESSSRLARERSGIGFASCVARANASLSAKRGDFWEVKHEVPLTTELGASHVSANGCRKT